MAMTLRLTPEQDHALTVLAAAHGTSKHEAAVRAIALAAARTVHDAQVQSVAREIIPGRAQLESDIRRSRPQR
ncbi:MAG: CopG family transcriptional regulator [Corynebacterium sp.]|nr:CopG family transcriptional regulator [Corynebacterium sp.]